MKKLQLFSAMLLTTVVLFITIGTACAANGELVLYLNWPRDQAEAIVDAFCEMHPEVDVQIFSAPIEELLTIVAMESRAGSVRADYIFIGDPARAEMLKEEGILYRYQPPAAILAGFQTQFLDPDGYYVPISIVPMVIQYNSRYISEDEAPRSFADLLNPKWRDKIAIADPRLAGSVHPPIRFIVENLADSPPYGWEFFEELAKLNPMVVGGHMRLREMVVFGERWIAASQSMDHIVASIDSGAPVWFSWPAEGVPAYFEVGAIVEGTKNLEQAKKFADWLASKEAHEVLYNKVGRVSARADVPFIAPDGIAIADVNLVPIGLDLTSEIRGEQAEHFHRIMQRF